MVAAILNTSTQWEPEVLAIDPTAPIIPVIPPLHVGDANDPAKALLALARAAVANNAAALGEIAVGGGHASAGASAEKASAGSALSTPAGPSGQPPVEPSTTAAPSIAERVAVAVRSTAAQAASRQSGLALMMANLDAALDRPETPEPVRQAARVVLGKALPMGQPITAGVLREAVQGSGVFLEARLAQTATVPTAQTLAPPADEAAGGDMKAALLVLRAVVSTWLAKAPAVAADPRIAAPKAEAQTAPPVQPAPSPLQSPATAGAERPILPMPSDDGLPAPPAQPEASAAGVRVATAGVASSEPIPQAELEAVQEAPIEPEAAQPPPAVKPPPTPPRPLLMVGLIEDEVVDLAPLGSPEEEAPLPTVRGGAYPSRPQATASRPPPPYAGGPTTAQAATVSDLPKDMSPAELARRLLKDVGGAIARQELSQIASLPEGHHEAERPAEAKSSRWVFDLPFQTPQGVAVAQFEINKDGGGAGGEGGREVERTWRARFSLDVEPLGPVHVQVALTGAMTRVGLWAERPEAMARLRAGEETLNAALRQAELTPEVAFHPGSPVAAPTAPGRFVDRET